MVRPPRIGLTKVLTSTCSPPSTKHASASVSSEPPETMTSMKAPISHGRPMLGSTLASGVISAPATAAKPAADREGHKADPAAVDAEPLRQRFVHDHGARVKAEPRAVKKRGEQSADENGDRDQK